MRVKRATRLGLCAGVRAADIAVRRFVTGGGSAAILGQIVHNERVVEAMEHLGVRTVSCLDDVVEPVVVISAHGAAPSLHAEARARGLEVLDTTCRFVYDIHRETAAALAAGAHLVFIGDPTHREVLGYTHDLEPHRYHVVQSVTEASGVDWAGYPAIRVFYQTTLNADEYEDVVRLIESANLNTRRSNTICYATRQNQDAARELAADPEVGVVLVVGGRQSANTRHLFEICARLKPSYLIQGAADIDVAWLDGIACVGLTAGASTPENVVAEVEAYLQGLGSHAATG